MTQVNQTYPQLKAKIEPLDGPIFLALVQFES